MRRKFINWFAVLILVLLALWIVGAVYGEVIPIFGGVRAQRFGTIALSIAALAEGVLLALECLVEWASNRKPEQHTGFPGPKRYGNKKL